MSIFHVSTTSVCMQSPDAIDFERQMSYKFFSILILLKAVLVYLVDSLSQNSHNIDGNVSGMNFVFLVLYFDFILFIPQCYCQLLTRVVLN